MNIRHVSVLWAAALLVLAACSDDESTVAPPPSSDRYVNRTTGDDANDGSAGAPWATISHAVATADSEITIRVAPGTYNSSRGETFPIVMKKGQRLIGNVGSKGAGATPTRIEGGGAYPLGTMDGTAVVGAEGARVAGFSIVNLSDYYVGVAVDGVTMQIDHNTFLGGMYAGVNAGNGASLDAHDNLFHTDVFGLILDGSGVVRVHDNTMEYGRNGVRANGIDSLEVADNVINTWDTGVIAALGTWIMIRNNTFNPPAGNLVASIQYSGGLVLIRENTFFTSPGVRVDTGLAVPDLGTAASPGLNDFAAIPGVALRHVGQGTVMAIGNTWANNPPQVGVDILITGGGTVVTQ